MEFDLVERNGRPTDTESAVDARALLRSAWAIPRDTLIADEIPVLLAKLSQIPPRPTTEG